MQASRATRLQGMERFRATWLIDHDLSFGRPRAQSGAPPLAPKHHRLVLQVDDCFSFCGCTSTVVRSTVCTECQRGACSVFRGREGNLTRLLYSTVQYSTSGAGAEEAAKQSMYCTVLQYIAVKLPRLIATDLRAPL